MESPFAFNYYHNIFMKIKPSALGSMFAEQNYLLQRFIHDEDSCSAARSLKKESAVSSGHRVKTEESIRRLVPTCTTRGPLNEPSDAAAEMISWPSAARTLRYKLGRTRRPSEHNY
jgi:hypothetical protein